MIKLNEESNNDNKKFCNLKGFLKEKKPKKIEFIIAIIANIIFLYIVNNLMAWNISFIADSLSDILWILNISIIANILANIIYLIYYSEWLRVVSQIILNILGFWVAYSLYVVFPFNFSNILYDYAVVFALIVAMIALVIASFVEVVRLILKFVNVEK